MIINIENYNKVEREFDQLEFVKLLNKRWTSQYTNDQSDKFFQTNIYVSALFNLRFLGASKEKTEVKNSFRDMKEEMFLDTEILLKEDSITVYDITGISILFGGNVVATLKNGRKEDVYTRNNYGRQLMLVNNKAQINLTRPGLQDYYKQNKEKYPIISELNKYFKVLPTRDDLCKYKVTSEDGPRQATSEDVARLLYQKLNFTPRKLMILINEYLTFHKECRYQLCHETFKGSD